MQAGRERGDLLELAESGGMLVLACMGLTSTSAI